MLHGRIEFVRRLVVPAMCATLLVAPGCDGESDGGREGSVNAGNAVRGAQLTTSTSAAGRGESVATSENEADGAAADEVYDPLAIEGVNSRDMLAEADRLGLRRRMSRQELDDPSMVREVETTAVKPGYRKVNFSALAGFEYSPVHLEEGEQSPGSDYPDQIPRDIRALDGEKVAVAGFMLPVNIRGGKVTEFLLVRNQLMCCFGVSVGMNEWIQVKMEGVGAEPLQDEPIVAHGTLEVGERFEDGILMSVYRMNCDDAVPQGGF